MSRPIELEQLPDADRSFIYGASVTGRMTHGLLAVQGHLVAGYFDTFKAGEGITGCVGCSSMGSA